MEIDFVLPVVFSFLPFTSLFRSLPLSEEARSTLPWLPGFLKVLLGQAYGVSFSSKFDV